MIAHEDYLRRLVEEGTVVQINPNLPMWGGCLMVVTEVKEWGVQGYVTIPQGDKAAQAYVRVNWEHLEFIGRAVWMRA